MAALAEYYGFHLVNLNASTALFYCKRTNNHDDIENGARLRSTGLYALIWSKNDESKRTSLSLSAFFLGTSWHHFTFLSHCKSRTVVSNFVLNWMINRVYMLTQDPLGHYMELQLFSLPSYHHLIGVYAKVQRYHDSKCCWINNTTCLQ